MDNVAPKQNQEPPEFKGWAGGCFLTLLRFWGGIVLGYFLLVWGVASIFPIYDQMEEVTSVIVFFVSLLLFGVYFGWFYHDKNKLHDVVSRILTGTIYFCGGVAVTIIGVALTIAPYFSSRSHEKLLNFFYLLGGLATVIIVMKGKRQF